MGVILRVVSETPRFDPFVHGILMANLFHRKEWKKCYKINLVSESPRGGPNKVIIHAQVLLHQLFPLDVDIGLLGFA